MPVGGIGSRCIQIEIGTYYASVVQAPGAIYAFPPNPATLIEDGQYVNDPLGTAIIKVTPTGTKAIALKRNASFNGRFHYANGKIFAFPNQIGIETAEADTSEFMVLDCSTDRVTWLPWTQTGEYAGHNFIQGYSFSGNYLQTGYSIPGWNIYRVNLTTNAISEIPGDPGFAYGSLPSLSQDGYGYWYYYQYPYITRVNSSGEVGTISGMFWPDVFYTTYWSEPVVIGNRGFLYSDHGLSVVDADLNSVTHIPGITSWSFGVAPVYYNGLIWSVYDEGLIWVNPLTLDYGAIDVTPFLPAGFSLPQVSPQSTDQAVRLTANGILWITPSDSSYEAGGVVGTQPLPVSVNLNTIFSDIDAAVTPYLMPGVDWGLFYGSAYLRAMGVIGEYSYWFPYAPREYGDFKIIRLPDYAEYRIPRKCYGGWKIGDI